ncbi:unnamed protein product, partial [Didymodactylos carnosus]
IGNETEDLINRLLANDNTLKSNDQLNFILSCDKLFCTCMKCGVLSLPRDISLYTNPSSTLSSDETCRRDLILLYKCYLKYLLKCLQATSTSKKIQRLRVQSLVSLFKLLKYESRWPLAVTGDNKKFPVHLLNDIIQSCFLQSNTTKSVHLMKKCRVYFNFVDIRYFTLKQLLQQQQLDASNLLTMLTLFKFDNDESEPKLFTFDKSLKKHDKSEQKKLYDQVIVELLSQKFSPDSYHRFLLQIPEKIITQMANPLILADFLTQAYSSTSTSSSKILALHGIYILMTEHNLEYPYFYVKLYSLLDVNLFQMKYKARFFYLLNIFLQSSHLPSSLIGGFLKRLSRLCLYAPQTDLCLLITFIQNLLIRHPVTQIMIHKQTTSETTDGYLVDELDPSKSNALESSLWEIESLTTHIYPDVSQLARFIIQRCRPQNKTERDLDKYLDVDYEQMFDDDMEISDRRQDNDEGCPINYEMNGDFMSSTLLFGY